MRKFLKEPAMLSDTDRAAIKRASEQIVAMINAKDFSAAVKFYAEDAILFARNAPNVEGREAIIRYCQKFPPLSNYRHETQEMEGMGNLVYNLEKYSVTLMLPGVPAYQVTARGIWIWKKQADGSWKVWREIFNWDHSAPEGMQTGQQ
jgi:ketosteroid isomerase-like protein